jgi:hypothetical protein
MVGLTESDVIACVDRKVSRVDVVPFQGGLQKLWVVDCAVLLEVQLLVLLLYDKGTFVLTPKNLNSYTSTLRSYLN